MTRREETGVGTIYFREGAELMGAQILMTLPPNGPDSLAFQAAAVAREAPVVVMTTDQGRRAEAERYLRERFPGLQAIRWNQEQVVTPDAVLAVDAGFRWPVPVQAYGEGQPGNPVLMLSPNRGWTTLSDRVARHFASQGRPVYGIATPNLPYWYEEATGRALDLAGMHETVMRLTAELGLERPLIAGHSLGGFFALAAAGLGFPAERLLLYGNAPCPLGDLCPLAARVAPIPLLLVQGTADKPEVAERLYEAAGEPKRLILIEGADHHFTGVEDRLIHVL